MIRAPLRSILGVVLRVHAVRALGLTFIYALVLGLSIALAYGLRFDFDMPEWIRPNLVSVCTIAVSSL